MFYLTIDKDIHIRTLHPNDTVELFRLVEVNRSRLCPWIHPSALPENYKAARKFTIECFLNSLGNLGVATVEYNDYYQELEYYTPLPSPPMELRIWFDKCLAGEIMLGRLLDSYTTVEFGYWISSDMEGRGIVIHCVSGLMDYAIENMDIDRFVLDVLSTTSAAVPSRSV